MNFEFRELDLPGVIEVRPKKFGDDRGFFSEVYNEDNYRQGGISETWIQDNHSLSAIPGTLRGLHYQLPPFAQAKLVRVAKGRVFDVAVDIRKGSPNFGQWVGIELSAEKWNQLYIPAGFAHGFMTLEAETAFLYKVSGEYSTEHDRSIRYNDPEIGINWPVGDMHVILSAKDRDAPLLQDADNSFVYGD